MNDKLLFRALSYDDIVNLNMNNGIQSRLNSPITGFKQALDNATVQVSSGSKNKTRWISTSKNFFVCAEEYAIPQIGNYNLARCRRKIAMISRNAEISAPTSYNFNDINSTYVKSGNNVLDLGDNNNWPNITKVKNKYCFMNNPCCSNLKYKGWHTTLSSWNQFTLFDKFIFDLSPDYKTDKILKYANRTPNSGNYAPLHLLSLRRLMDAKLITNKISSPHITCSTSNDVKEVLFANSISNNAIVKVLSFEEIDFLYAFKKLTISNNIIFTDILNQLLTSGLCFKYNSIFVLDKLINNKSQSKNLSFLQDFENEKECKRLQLFGCINYQLNTWNINMPFTCAKDISILEDAICVAQIGGQTNTTILKKRKFKNDIVAILDTSSNVISYQESNYEGILEDHKNNLCILDNNQVSKIIFTL
ncbi:hypothetical protein [Clostridium vincentii]|uniref:Uncharacterized protein n=1 Tax=Clostridium vincentii TaxID=52704 RepID=A0A2T0BL05_9CLOT|nr:hypothetical protein [Clostridium vincentii]PRR84566.1 hypothetical protein CLVI_00890 [Clostridium vincentii]